MKWPEHLILVRHDISAYNALKKQREQDPEYQAFRAAFDHDYRSDECVELAQKMAVKYSLSMSDPDTPLADGEGDQALKTAIGLSVDYKMPDVIFVSPYERTKKTFQMMIQGWPGLENVKVYEDERIREQEHGLANLYNDWRVFQALHPEQRLLYQQEGRYWYRYPQGENVPDVRLRNRLWIDALVRDFRSLRVMAITHHLNILATRANFERLSAEEFIHLDEDDKPINCGVTLYEGNPRKGRNGKLELAYYNKKFY